MYKTSITISLIFSCIAVDISEELLNIILKGKVVPEPEQYSLNGTDYPNKPALRKMKDWSDDYFCAIQTFHVKPVAASSIADEANANDYPWIARVYHSKTDLVPLMCTAAAIRKKVFLTAGACLATAKVTYTSVDYQNHRILSLAFVMPSVKERSSQMFDDLAFIVVENSSVETWITIRPIDVPQRTGDDFKWFDKLEIANKKINTVVGYLYEDVTPHIHTLYKIDRLLVSTELCHKLVKPKTNTDSYMVPCFHPYTVQEEKAVNAKNRKYLAGLGHVLYRIVDGQPSVVGIATWVCGTGETYLPVGIAVPNSDVYFNNLECAEKISKSEKKTGLKSLCP